MEHADPGSWESTWAAQEPCCSVCAGHLRHPWSQDGACDTCNGLPATPRERPIHEWEPVAVVWPKRFFHGPETFWADLGREGQRQRQIHLAHRLASLTHGRVELL